jgi:hypothetical protein
MHRRKGETGFCSDACARDYMLEISDHRQGGTHGPPALPKPAPERKLSPAAQRMRDRVEACEQKTPLKPLIQNLQLPAPTILQDRDKVQALDDDPDAVWILSSPELVRVLQKLALPKQAPAPLRLRGLSPPFSIGDLALIAPVELPQSTDGLTEPAPHLTAKLRPLGRPAPVSSACPAYVGLEQHSFKIGGRPLFLEARDPDAANEVAGFVERLDPSRQQSSSPKIEVAIQPSSLRTTGQIGLGRPRFCEIPLTLSRVSGQDRLMEIGRPNFPVHATPELEQKAFLLAPLELKLLAAPARRIRTAGAGLVCSNPIRPVPFLIPSPAILALDITFFEPSWRRDVPIPIPGFRPEPRVGKRSCQEMAPWFVPSRPKPPMLSFEILATPPGWRNPAPQPGLTMKLPVTAPPRPLEHAQELSSLADAVAAEEAIRSIDAESPWPKRRRIPVFTPMADWWLTCSNQVRVMVIALPLLIAIALKPLAHGAGGGNPTMEERPTAPVRSAHAENPRQGLPTDLPDMPRDLEAKLERATRSQVDGFKRAIVSRSAVEMADDFQAGLDSWDGNGQLGPSWSYDRTGFIRPRALGIYRPSTGLADYAFEFLGKIDQRAVSWVFRASDLNNYYAMKLVDKTGGVTPQMALVHYAVIEGREGPKKEVPLPLSVYKDTLFRIRMDVQGPHFSVQVQGTVVDYWKDSRLKSGGVGFFASRGEESRVRWVQVTHQDDMLGKFCAFLAPYAM